MQSISTRFASPKMASRTLLVILTKCLIYLLRPTLALTSMLFEIGSFPRSQLLQQPCRVSFALIFLILKLLEVLPQVHR